MNFSLASERFFSLCDKVHYKCFEFTRTSQHYRRLITLGRLPRPHYALGVFLSAYLAHELSVKKIAILEFGCWQGEALFDLERFASDVESIIDIEIEIEIYGFEGGKGLPESSDYKDRLYQFSPGEMKTGSGNYFDQLRRAKIFFGEFNKSVFEFMNCDHAPIGCIFNDADYFSSTLDSLEVLKDAKSLMPKIYLYFDDLNFSSSFTGELGAINTFNQLNELKIETIPELAEYLSLYWNKWIVLGKRFFMVHNFNHKDYNRRYRNALLEPNI